MRALNLLSSNLKYIGKYSSPIFISVWQNKITITLDKHTSEILFSKKFHTWILTWFLMENVTKIIREYPR